MNVPLLDLRAQLEYLEDDLKEALTRVLTSTRWIQGPEVEGLEKEIAEYCGCRYGIGVSSGTDALLVSLMSLGIGQGDKVLTTPYSFFATMGVILRVGAVPVFADIEPESFNMDVQHVRGLLESDTAKEIKAIIPVHLYGQCAEMKEIIDLANEFSIPVIEDAAQAIGAQYPWQDEGKTEFRRAGSMGLAGCFSFFPSKNLGGVGDGGMVVTNDKSFAEKLVLMRNHGAQQQYFHESVGGNFRLDPLQAAALRVKLPYLEGWHKGRAANSKLYNRLFQESGLIEKSKVVLPREIYSSEENILSGKTHIYNQYILRVSERDSLQKWLQQEGVGCAIYYPVSLNQQQCFIDLGGNCPCPVAEKAAQETIALPIYPELTDEMQEYVVDKIVQFYS